MHPPKLMIIINSLNNWASVKKISKRVLLVFLKTQFKLGTKIKNLKKVKKKDYT